MRFYQAWHVLCPRIANLYSASAENCVKFIRYWKVLIYQIQKSFSYVRGNIFVKSWIELDNVRGAISYLFYVLFICINLTFLWLSLRAFSYSPFDMSKTFCLKNYSINEVPVHHPYTSLKIVYQVYLIIKIVYRCRQACRFRHHQNCPWWCWSGFLYFFFFQGSL